MFCRCPRWATMGAKAKPGSTLGGVSVAKCLPRNFTRCCPSRFVCITSVREFKRKLLKVIQSCSPQEPSPFQHVSSPIFSFLRREHSDDCFLIFRFQKINCRDKHVFNESNHRGSGSRMHRKLYDTRKDVRFQTVSDLSHALSQTRV